MTKPKFKILSIDGGGIRGIIPCKILSYIETQIGGNLSDTFDLIAGTSTGGIITLGLTTKKPDDDCPYYAEEMLELYRKNGKLIFAKRQKDFLSRIGSVFKKTKAITENPYDSSNLEKLLSDYFRGAMLKNSKTNVLVTTYDISEGKPFIFSTRLAKVFDSENIKEDFLVEEIARSTSAAPTYFEPSIIRDKAGGDFAFVDGGVFANNPSILAYCEGKELYKIQTKAFDAKVTQSDSDLPFYLLSIGTGISRQRISGQDAKKWRAANWLNPLLSSVFMQSVAESTHYTLQHLLPPYENGTPRYQRINVTIPEENSQMDNVSDENINKLCEFAENYIKENESTLLQVCEMLK